MSGQSIPQKLQAMSRSTQRAPGSRNNSVFGNTLTTLKSVQRKRSSAGSKHRSASADDRSPEIWSGWLAKTGSKDNNFHKRYFRLRENGHFDYYDTEKSTTPKGTCDLKDASAVQPTKDGFTISTRERVWRIQRADADIGQIIVHVMTMTDEFKREKEEFAKDVEKPRMLREAQYTVRGNFACMMIEGEDM
jgi:hypothetical protein